MDAELSSTARVPGVPSADRRSASIPLRAVWWASNLALVAVLLRIWHLVLMKEALDQLLVLSGWIACGWVMVATALACERSAAADGAGIPKLWSPRSSEFWTMGAVFSVLLLLFHVGFMRATGDGRGFFAQVHSMVIDRDLEFQNDIKAFAARRPDARFPMGTAVMWTPFFLLAHAWLGLLNLFGADYSRDGFWNPYQRAVGLGTFLYGFAAFVMIYAALGRAFTRGAALVAALAVLLATPVVWYLAIDSSMSHGASLFVVTAFLTVWLTTREQRRIRDWVLLAALAGLMAAVRPQNLLFLGVLGVEAVAVAWRQWHEHRDFKAIARVAAVYVLPLVVTLAVLSYVLGAWAQGRGYLFAHELFEQFRLVNQLFSPNHGLVSSSPVLAFALLGLPLLFRTDRLLACAFLLIVAAQVTVGAASAGWDAGASFGARRFVECALLFAFGLAAIVELAKRRPLIPIGMGLGALALINLALVQDARRGRLTLSEQVPFERMMYGVTSRIGNPFALPGSLYFAWKHDVPIERFDRLPSAAFRNFSLDVGGENDGDFLLDGWHGRERDRRTFRWAQREAFVFMRLYQGPYRLRVVVEPFAWKDAPPQTMEVRLDGVPLETFDLPRGFTLIEYDVPEVMTPPLGFVRLSFHFDHARSPSEVGMGDDPRVLAARFDVIEMRVQKE
jgi:hypothetical protein